MACSFYWSSPFRLTSWLLAAGGACQRWVFRLLHIQQIEHEQEVSCPLSGSCIMWLTLSLSGGFPVAIHDVTVSFLILTICTRKTIYRALLGAAAPYIDNWLSGNAPWFLQQIDLHTLKFYTLGVNKSICKCAFSLEVIERVCRWSVDGIWLGLKCLVAFKHSSPDMVIKRIKVWWVWS